MTLKLQLPPGQHSVAVYVEDWGGRAWIAATVKAAGQVVRKTGDGQWKTTGSLNISPLIWWNSRLPPPSTR